MTPQPGVFENPEQNMYRRGDGEYEDGHVHELVADDGDVCWSNLCYLWYNRGGQDENE